MVDNPITRKEKYLAKLTGSYTGNVPAPITRVEKYLYDLCQKGISGLTPEEIENAVNKYLEGKDYVTKTDADKAYQPAGSYLSGTDEGLAVSGKAADAKAVGNAVAKIEGINYTDRGTLSDTDAFLVNDGTGMKKSVLSKLSDFVLGKIADKVFAKLQTSDKTILGAINELNSNQFSIYEKEVLFGQAVLFQPVLHLVPRHGDITVTTASAVNIGNFTIIQFEINVLNTIPSKKQLIMNVPTRAPYTNMITGVVIESRSLENNYIYVDRYSDSVGGISIVTAKSLPTGNYRGNVAFISTSK